MRLLYFDCQSGISGDMAVGALLDMGVDLQQIAVALSDMKLPLVYDIEAEKLSKCGVEATAFRVFPEKNQTVCFTEQMREWLQYSQLTECVKARALASLQCLEQARIAVYGKDGCQFLLQDAVSCLVQMVSASSAMHCLGADAVFSSPLTEGSGFAETKGGFMRLPIPVVMELARAAGAPFEICEERTQLITETGAAIVCAATQRFAPMPSMTVEAIGFGAGMKELDTRANVLRVILGENRYSFFGEHIYLAESTCSFGDGFEPYGAKKGK